MSNTTLFTRLIFGIIFLGIFGSASALTLDQQQPNNHAQLLAKRHSQPNQLDNAWVEPYLERIQIKGSSQDASKVIQVWIMADDNRGAKVYFNQVSKKFGLAHYQPGERPYTNANYRELQNVSDIYTSGN